MTEPIDFPRYLAAKRSIDDRALNRHVWQTLADALASQPAVNRPLRVLEVGAGIGTMIERCVEWKLFGAAEYTAIDSAAENIQVARQRLGAWQPPVSVQLQQADLYEFAARPENHQRHDLLIAHALLDLLHLPTALPALLGMLRPGGLFYFTINFDGATLFLPEIDLALDQQIEALYHRSMDDRITDGKPSGDSRSGRRLYHQLLAAGAQVLAAGSSDWVVHGDQTGQYPQDEAYFLHCILHFVETTLRGHPELDASGFADWLRTRRGQIDRAELLYIAHQLDYCGRVPD